MISKRNYLILRILFMITGFSAIGSVVLMFIIHKPTNIQYHKQELTELAAGWTLTTADASNTAISLPYAIDMPSHGSVTLTRTLPDGINDGEALYFNCYYMAQGVYVNGEKIYSFAEEKPYPFGQMRGTAFAIVPLKSEYSNQLLTIEVTNPYNATTVNWENVYFGSEGEMKYQQLWDNLWRLGLFFVFVALSLFSVVFGISQIIVSVSERSLSFIYFAMLALSVGAWIIVDPAIMQFFAFQSTALQYVSFASLAFIGAFYSGLCGTLFRKQGPFFHCMELIGYVLFMLMLIFYVTNLMDPVSYMYVLYVYAFVTLIAATIMIFKHAKEYNYSKLVALGTIMLIAGVAIAVGIFMKNPASGNTVLPFISAYTLYIFMMFIIVLRNEQEMIREAISVKTYKELAYTDQLTGLYNRAAFEIAMDRISRQLEEEHHIVMYIGDLNHLKKTNDQMGHDVGDQLIINAAKALKYACGAAATPFRLGGDEFAIITIDQDLMPIEQLELIQNSINRVRDEEQSELSMALGYAELNTPNTDVNVRDVLYRDADKKMYANKMHMRNQA